MKDRGRDRRGVRPVSKEALILDRLTSAEWRSFQYAETAGIRHRIYHPRTPVVLNSENWDGLVVQGVTVGAYEEHIRLHGANQKLDYRIKGAATSSFSSRILDTFAIHETQSDEKMTAGKLTLAQYRSEKMGMLRRLASTIKATGEFQVFRDVWRDLVTMEKDPKETDHSLGLLAHNVRGLFLLAGSHNRILAGFEEDVPLWKNVEMPQVYRETGVPIIHACTPYIELIEGIQKSYMLDILPARIPGPRAKLDLDVPQVKNSIGDSMVDIYYNQQFMIPPEGLTVAPRDGGEIKTVRIVGFKDWLLALTETKTGEQYTTQINTETGTGYSTETMIKILSGSTMADAFQNSPLPPFVAAMYRSALCDESKRSARRFKERRDYDGEPKQVQPHVTRGYRRYAGPRGMTLKQLDRVEEFLKSGLKVPKPGPEQTIASPSVTPKGSEAAIRAAPPVVREYHQAQAFDVKEFKVDDGEVLTLDMIRQLRDEIRARRAVFAS